MFDFSLSKSFDKQFRFRLGEESVCINVYGCFDHIGYFRSLKHLEVSESAETSLNITLIESKTTGLYPPEELLGWKRIDPYNGELIGLPVDYFAVHNTNELSFIWIHYSKRSIIYWVDDFSLLAPNEWVAPLRNVFHLWFRNSHLFLCHAAGIGLDGNGILLSGKGGVGKSTSTLACLESELQYSGDDFMLVDSQKLIAYSLYSVAKLNIDQFERFEYLKKHIANIEYVPKEKGQVFINEIYNKKMALKYNIKAILIPEYLGGTDTTIMRCSKAEVIKALMPSSIWILRSKINLQNPMRNLINMLESIKLTTGKDLSQIPKKILEILHEN